MRRLFGWVLLLFVFLGVLTLSLVAREEPAQARRVPEAAATATPVTCFYTPLNFNLSGFGTIENTRPFTPVSGDSYFQFGSSGPITATSTSGGAVLLGNNMSGNVSGGITGTFVISNLNGIAITGSTASPEARGFMLNNLAITSTQGSMIMLFTVNFAAFTSNPPYYPRTFNGYVQSVSTTGAYASYAFFGTITGVMGQPSGGNGAGLPWNAVIQGKLYNGFSGPMQGVATTNGSRTLPPLRSLTFQPTDVLAQFYGPDFQAGASDGNFSPLSVFAGTAYGALNGPFTLENDELLVGNSLTFSRGWLAGNMRITNNSTGDVMYGPWLIDLNLPGGANGQFFQTGGTGIFANSHIFGWNISVISYQGGVDLAASVGGYYCGDMIPVGGTPTTTPTVPSTATPTATYTPTFTISATATRTPTACSAEYTYSVLAGSIISGTTLIPGSQCGTCIVPVTLPFPFTYYGHSYTTTNVLTIGNVQFATTDTSSNTCPAPYSQLGPAILPDWDSGIDTSATQICQSQVGRACGVYTSVSGSAPNRIFNIEWVGRRAGSNTYSINFELRLYETIGVFDFIYGVVLPPPAGHTSSIGIQNGLGSYLSYACNLDDSITQGRLIRWSPTGCLVTPTPTRTFTITPTRTLTPLRTSTPTNTLTSTSTITPTPPACVSNYMYSVSTGSVISGTTLLPGSQCGNCIAPLTLPFPFTFYGHSYTTANVLTTGNVQFTTAYTPTNTCPAPYSQLGPTILPNWDSWLDTSYSPPCQQQFGRPCGVYTLVTGSPPNRALHIEWLTRRSGSNTYTARFELRLHESTGLFEFVYADVLPPPAGHTSSIGVQNGSSGLYTNYACNVDDSISSGLLIAWYAPNPCQPTVTPTVTPTSPRTSTPTGTLASTSTPTQGTPEPTPTLCPISFTDVHPTDYFYVPVQYLYCRGVISGYGTEFRPYNNTSRGQLTKIVVLGFNVSIDTTGGPHFVDVPTTNVFYPYVETAYNGGIISGYGTEFRPNDNVTRGQLCKIVVLTAHWDINITGGPHFTDVPAGSTFYGYVETGYNKGIINGYGSLFKPNNPATRGQICKIVYLAITQP